MLASVDGAIGPAGEARIPVTDEGLLRGDGAFEVLRLYSGRAFALEDHFARLARSCAGLRLDADFVALRAEVAALLEQAGPVEGLLRIVLTRGGRRLAIVEPLPRHAPVARVMTVRYAPNRVLDGLKTLSYAGNMLARRLAEEAGYDEALLVTPHGRVLEGPTWSFFWVRDGELLTPPLEDRILASITRGRIIAATGATEEPCTLEDLRAAEEAFIASTVREVLPIAAIDDLQLPAAPGAVTLRTRETLAEAIERELGAFRPRLASALVVDEPDDVA
jgi:branched-chain amino acid aminotransferase